MSGLEYTQSTLPIEKCPLCQREGQMKETIRALEVNHLYRSMVDFDVVDRDFNYFICSHCTLGFFRPEPTIPDRLYPHLSEYKWYYQPEKTEFKRAAKLIVERDLQNVLEIGCGEGYFAKYLPPGTRYVGLEKNPVAVSKGSNSQLDIRPTDIEQFSSENAGRFDAVVSGVFHQDITRLV